MKIWKCIVMAGLLSVTASYPVAAGTGDTSPPQVSQRLAGNEMVSKRMESMVRRLSLTAEQQAAIKSVLEEQAAKLSELRADNALTPVEKKVKMAELREANDHEIRSLLTPEQQVKHDEWLNALAERRKSKKQGTIEPVSGGR